MKWFVWYDLALSCGWMQCLCAVCTQFERYQNWQRRGTHGTDHLLLFCLYFFSDNSLIGNFPFYMRSMLCLVLVMWLRLASGSTEPRNILQSTTLAEWQKRLNFTPCKKTCDWRRFYLYEQLMKCFSQGSADVLKRMQSAESLVAVVSCS